MSEFAKDKNPEEKSKTISKEEKHKQYISILKTIFENINYYINSKNPFYQEVYDKTKKFLENLPQDFSLNADIYYPIIAKSFSVNNYKLGKNLFPHLKNLIKNNFLLGALKLEKMKEETNDPPPNNIKSDDFEKKRMIDLIVDSLCSVDSSFEDYDIWYFVSECLEEIVKNPNVPVLKGGTVHNIYMFYLRLFDKFEGYDDKQNAIKEKINHVIFKVMNSFDRNFNNSTDIIDKNNNTINTSNNISNFPISRSMIPSLSKNFDKFKNQNNNNNLKNPIITSKKSDNTPSLFLPHIDKENNNSNNNNNDTNSSLYSNKDTSINSSMSLMDIYLNLDNPEFSSDNNSSSLNNFLKINLYICRTVKNLVDIICYRDSSKELKFSEKGNISSLVPKTYLDIIENKFYRNMKIPKIKNEIFEQCGKFGWCYICRKKANYYCIDTRMPLCGFECKKILKEEENFLSKVKIYLIKDSSLMFKEICKIISDQNYSNKEKIFILDIISKIFNNYGKLLKSQKYFIQTVKNELSEGLFKTCLSMESELLIPSISLYFQVWELFRENLKREINLFNENVFIKILTSQNSSFLQKKIILENFLNCDISYFIELYANYDCELNEKSTMDSILNSFCDIVKGKYSKCLQNLDNKEIQELVILALKNLSNILENIFEMCEKEYGCPEKNEIYKTNTFNEKNKIFFNKNKIISNINNNSPNNNNNNTNTNKLVNNHVRYSERLVLFNDKFQDKYLVDQDRDKDIIINNDDDEELDFDDDLDEFAPQMKKPPSFAQKSFSASKNAPTDSYIKSHSSNNCPKVCETTEKLIDYNLRIKQEKKQAAKEFNQGIKSGLSYLKNLGHTSSKSTEEEAKDIAMFLRYTPTLKKSNIGEFLGGDSELSKLTLKYFTQTFDFRNIHIIEALRIFLSTFLLPAEGQKIDRIIENFSEKYFDNNKELFSSSDTCFYLVYSIMMLQTELHNPNVRQKMDLDKFIKLFEDQGKDEKISKEYLSDIYKQIEEEPFSLAELEEEKEKDNNDNMEEKFSREKKRLLTDYNYKTKAKSNYYINKEEKNYLILKNNPEISGYLSRFVQSIWSPLIPMYNIAIEETDDEKVYNQSIKGITNCIKAMALLNLHSIKKTVVSFLCAMTGLFQIKSLKDKNILCIKEVLNIANGDYRYSKESWSLILDIVNKLIYYNSFNSMPKDEIEEVFEKKRQSTHRKNLNLINEEIETEKQIMQVLQREISSDEYEKIFSKKMNFDSGSLYEFVKGICEIAKKEFKNNSLTKIFFLQKIVEVTEINLLSMPRNYWKDTWTVLNDFFIEIGLSDDIENSNTCLDSLRQLITKYLARDEKKEYLLQNEFLNPFYETLKKSKNNFTQEYIICCINNLVRREVKKIRTGWSTILNIYEELAKIKNLEGIQKQTLDTLKYVAEHNTKEINPIFERFILCIEKYYNLYNENVLEIFQILLKKVNGEVNYKILINNYWPILMKMEEKNIEGNYLKDFFEFITTKIKEKNGFLADLAKREVFWKNIFMEMLIPSIDNLAKRISNLSHGGGGGNINNNNTIDKEGSIQNNNKNTDNNKNNIDFNSSIDTNKINPNNQDKLSNNNTIYNQTNQSQTTPLSTNNNTITNNNNITDSNSETDNSTFSSSSSSKTLIAAQRMKLKASLENLLDKSTKLFHEFFSFNYRQFSTFLLEIQKIIFSLDQVVYNCALKSLKFLSTSDKMRFLPFLHPFTMTLVSCTTRSLEDKLVQMDTFSLNYNINKKKNSEIIAMNLNYCFIHFDLLTIIDKSVKTYGKLISNEDIISLLSCLEKSISVSKNFNSKIELRIAITKFIQKNTNINLYKQFQLALKNYLSILDYLYYHGYNKNNEENFLTKDKCLKTMLDFCSSILDEFVKKVYEYNCGQKQSREEGKEKSEIEIKEAKQNLENLAKVIGDYVLPVIKKLEYYKYENNKENFDKLLMKIANCYSKRLREKAKELLKLSNPNM